MATQSFEGIGASLTEARTRADLQCNAWLHNRRDAGVIIVDESRGSITTKTASGEFLCEVTLSYRELAQAPPPRIDGGFDRPPQIPRRIENPLGTIPIKNIPGR